MNIPYKKFILFVFLISSVSVCAVAQAVVESHFLGPSSRTDFIKEMQEEYTAEKSAENFRQMMQRTIRDADIGINNAYLEKFFQITMNNADQEDRQAIASAEESISKNCDVRHQSVYVTLVVRNRHFAETTMHQDGWFIMSHYSEAVSEKPWFHHVLYFKMQYY